MTHVNNDSNSSSIEAIEAKKTLSERARILLTGIAGVALLLLAMLASCGTGSADSDLRDAEMALAQGDMTAARSAAEKLTDNKNLSGMTASQLARLSIVYMQLADSDGGDELVANAADLYRRAYKADADSAEAYYQSLPAEHQQTAENLRHLVSAADATYSFDDTIAPDDTAHFDLQPNE